ncbi:X-box-binding protein 1 isoform X2 [Cylas formicarius]|uniref:X-box-binding protein 1 isoform X2 n=1 Tax=Cylas formicarius TaxID=197179 RepID=UPI002958D9B9|nr:X-box-binding protein 1 isoform X2 [Cylas formicarius]
MTSVPLPTILKFLNDNNNYMVDQNVEAPAQRAKKRRLDHLSWEEKIQRKKLKNRVAAQTSRDRKKAKLEQMEGAIQQLFNKNETLIAECEKLRAANERLQAENVELHQRLQVSACQNCHQNRSVVCEVESGSAESLLRPKGTTTHSAALLGSSNSITKTALLKMVLACLLYRTFSMNSNQTLISTPLNNSHSLCSKISPETWRLLLKRQLIKNQPLIEKIFQEKWWGRHQNNWNPVEVKC